MVTFADLQAANAADATQAANSGLGLDFGTGCTAASATAVTGITLTDTEGVYVRGADAGSTTTWCSRCMW